MIHRSSAAGDDMVRTGALLTSRECRWLRSRAMSLPSGAAARASSLPCGGAARGRFCGSRSARGRPAHNHCTLVCPRRASHLLPGAPAQRAGRAGLRRLRPPAHRAGRDFGVFGRPLRHGGIPPNGRDGPASDAFALPPIGRDGTSASSDGPCVTAASRPTGGTKTAGAHQDGGPQARSPVPRWDFRSHSLPRGGEHCARQTAIRTDRLRIAGTIPL